MLERPEKGSIGHESNFIRLDRRLKPEGTRRRSRDTGEDPVAAVRVDVRRRFGGLAELANALALKASGRKAIGVRVPGPPLPAKQIVSRPAVASGAQRLQSRAPAGAPAAPALQREIPPFQLRPIAPIIVEQSSSGAGRSTATT